MCFLFNNTNGFILLNKPFGVSSSKILKHVKNLYIVDKVGYSGSLDPFATGMLPIFFGNYTDILNYLLSFNKNYIVKMNLGFVSETGDLDGFMISDFSVPEITFYDIQYILYFFCFFLKQISPIYSSIKYLGFSLYNFSVYGINIFKKFSTVFINEIFIISYNYFRNILDIYVLCSKGTYIRSLVFLIGKYLDCGSYIVYLKRINSGLFEFKMIINIFFLEKKNIFCRYKFLIDVEFFFIIRLIFFLYKNNLCSFFNYGRFNDVINLNGVRRLYLDNKFIGIVVFVNGILINKYLF